MLTTAIKNCIATSVLCWLATASAKNEPNVSPKEIFTYYGDNHLIIANIASPQSAKNIKANQQVCISLIDIFVQKGYQLKGVGEVIRRTDERYQALSIPLLAMTGGNFPFSSIFSIEITSVKPILAPSYLLYPETDESTQIANAMKTYKVREM